MVNREYKVEKSKAEKQLIKYDEYCPIRKITRKVYYYIPKDADISNFKNAVIVNK